MERKKKAEDHLGDFTTNARVLLLTVMSLGIGVVSALVAYVLVWLIGTITNLAFYQRFDPALTSVANNRLGWWVVIIPVIGGLIIGLMARYGSEKIRGHGIPEALEAILFARSRMEPKVAVLKPLSSALSIGTGGPFGAEGPIIMTGGAFGSLIAQFFHLSSAERKTLLVAGAAGGMAAIFSAPVSAVLLAIELLLFERKPRSFIPVAGASAVAGALRVPLLGPGPIFAVTPHAALNVEGLVIAAVVGIIAGFASDVMTRMVYGFEDLFTRLPLHWMWWPAIGGLGVGIGALIDPRALGVGYDIIHSLLRGEYIGMAILGLLITKAVIWSFSLGSGTSGGVVAPLLIMGGALGAFEAQWIPIGDAGLWAAVSMAAMMGGTMRAPMTAIVFTVELTHDLNILPALLVSTIAADAVTVLLLRRSILTEKVARRGYHLTHEYGVDPMDILRVGEVMDKNVPTIPATMMISELADLVAHGDPKYTHRQGIPIVNAQGNLVGIITRGDLLRALQQDGADGVTVLDAGKRNLIVTYPDELLREAVEKMLEHDIGRLPVVERDNPQRLVGYLGRSGIIEARAGVNAEENVRERVWAIPV